MLWKRGNGVGMIVVLALACSGCSAFMAGYREPYVRNIRIGMASAGVANLAGEPQRRDTVTTAAGPFEVWYYVAPACGGGFEERPVTFSDGSVIAVGREALESLQAFFAAYSTGYQKGAEGEAVSVTAEISALLSSTRCCQTVLHAAAMRSVRRTSVPTGYARCPWAHRHSRRRCSCYRLQS